MSKKLFIALLIVTSLFLSTPVFAQDGSIDTLNQFKSTSTPFNAITPRTSGKNIYAPYSVATTSTLNTTSTTASSTFANGLNITSGCFSVLGTCLGGNSIAGTGASTQLAYWLNGTTLTSSPLLTFASSILTLGGDLLVSGKVGIGTTTPSKIFEVYGAQPDFIARFRNTDPDGSGVEINNNSNSFPTLRLGKTDGTYSNEFYATKVNLGINGENVTIGGNISGYSDLNVKAGVSVGQNYYGAVTAPADGAAIEGAVAIGTTTLNSSKVNIDAGTSVVQGLNIHAVNPSTFTDVTGLNIVGATSDEDFNTTLSGIKVQNLAGGSKLRSNNLTLIQDDAAQFNIYATGGKSYFQNNVGFGTNIPASQVSISGGGLAMGSYATAYTLGDGIIATPERIGIGTPYPSASLEIQSSLADKAIVRDGAGETYFAITGDNTSVTGNISMGDVSSAGNGQKFILDQATGLFSFNNGDVSIPTNNLLLGTGKIGFGTNAPSQAITFNATAGNANYYNFQVNGVDTFLFGAENIIGPPEINRFVLYDYAVGAYTIVGQNGHLRIGGDGTVPSAVLELIPGTAAAGSAPFKLGSGAYNTTPEAGTLEWNSWIAENLTFTPSTVRYNIPLVDSGSLTSGRATFATTNGRLTDDSDFTFSTDTLTATKIAATTFTGNVTIAPGINIITDTGTGMKIGGGTTQKIGFWNATPIVRPTGSVAIDTLLINTGLHASGGVANFDSQIQAPASTASASSLRIALGTAPTTPVAGDIWNDTTQNILTFSNGNTLYSGGNLYTATADVALTSTSPTTAFSATKVGTTTFAANTLKVGQKFSVWGAGYYSTPLANTSTVTITNSMASSTAVTISTVTTAAFPASAVNLPFDYNINCTVRSIGASATAVCDGDFRYATALSAVAKTSNSLSTVGTFKFNSTVNQTFDTKVSWSAVTTQTATVQESRIDIQ